MSGLTTSHAAGATLPALLKILRYIKRTEDCMGVPHPPDFPPPTHNLHILCDLGIAVAPQIVRLMDPEADLGTPFPGNVPLPSAFFKALRGAGAPSTLSPASCMRA